MSKYQYIPTNASQPLPGRDFELQTVEFLDDAASRARWDKVEGRPGLASTEKDGLIPAEAMQKLEEIEATAEKLDALADVDAAPPPAWLRPPTGYQRSEEGWSSSPTCLFPPSSLCMTHGGVLRYCRAHPPFSINNAANWEGAYYSPSHRAGKEFYIHFLVFTNDTCRLALSAIPALSLREGLEASGLVGGFHCLCQDAGDIEGHALSGSKAGDILPMSLWDLWNRPQSSPAAMVYDPRLHLWVDVYLPGNDGIGNYGAAVATVDDGLAMRTTLQRLGKSLMNEVDLAIALSGTSPQDTDIPATAGGHADGDGRRILSDLGLEDKGVVRGCARPLWG